MGKTFDRVAILLIGPLSFLLLLDLSVDLSGKNAEI